MSSRSAARGTAAASSIRLTLRTSNAVATSNASPSRCFLFCEGSRAARSARTAAATVSTPPIPKAPPNQRRRPPTTSTFQAASFLMGGKGALAIHVRETEGQVKRLEQVFQIVGEQPEVVACKAIQGIIEEGQEILQEFQGGEAADAGLIAAAQAVEHYEITRYGTLLAWAKQLGLSEAEGLIQETLIEEENTDELLSDLAEDAINPAAAAAYSSVK